MADLTGTIIGRHQITERLGRGGMADVYKAFHLELNVYRAVKVIRPEFVTSDDFRARFQKEAQAIAGLRHQNIVQLHDFGSQDGAFFMVMEFIQGRDLKKILREGGALGIERALGFVRQIAGALQYAHDAGIVHRDIKPENIMVTDDDLPILTDFGIAKLLTSETQLTQTGMGIGTPAYMAPEQATATSQIGAAADIYALSIVLYETVTGQVPFSADTPMAVMLKAINDPLPMPRQLNSEVSDALQALILKGAAKDPADRFRSAGEMIAAIDAVLAEGIASPDMEPTVLRAPETSVPTRRRGGLLALAAVAVLAAIGAWWFWPRGLESGTPIAATTAARQPAAGESVEPASTPTSRSLPPSDVQTGAAGQRALVLAYRGRTEADTPIVRTLPFAAGDVVYLDVHLAQPTTDFVLMTPDGRRQAFSTYTDAGPYEMRNAGEYTLTIQTRGGKQAEVDFEMWRLEPAVIDGGALESARYVAGKTELPGQRAVYTWDARAAETVFLDVERTGATTDFVLAAPDGRREVFSSYADFGPIDMQRAGVHTLSVDPRGDAVTDWEFTLYRVDPPAIDGGALELGGYLTGSTELPGQVVTYAIALEADALFFLDVLETSATADFRLTSKDGRTEVFSSYADHGPVAVETTGVYTLTVDPRGDKVVDYDAVLWPSPEIAGGEIALGDVVTGRTHHPGEVVVYSFAGTAGQTVAVERLASSATTDVIVTAPDRRTRLSSTYADSGPLVLPQDGDYELRVDPRGDAKSEFEFVVNPNPDP